MHEIFKLADKLFMEDLQMVIRFNIQESPEVKIELEGYFEVKNTADETLLFSKFDRKIFETNKTEVMMELIMYTIKQTRDEQR